METRLIQALAATLKEAVALHNRSDFAAAAARYDAILSHAPSHFDALHLKGVIEMQQGRLESAIAYISKAIALDRKNGAALGNLGTAYRMSGDLDAAIKQFDRAVIIAPKMPDPWHNRALALKDQGKLEPALQSVRRAIALAPRNAHFICSLGVILKAQGKLMDALAAYDAALAINPNFTDARANRGTTFIAMGKAAEIEEELRLAIEANPNAVALRSSYGRCLQALGRSNDAISFLKSAVALAPNDAEQRQWLAQALRESEVFETALECLRNPPLPGNVSADFSGLEVDLLLDLNRPEEAAKICDAALVLKPRDSNLLRRRASVYLAQREPARALNCMERGLLEKPDDAVLLTERAILLARSGHIELGEKDIQRALKIAPSSDVVNGNAGNFYVSIGRPDEGLGLHRRCVELNPLSASGQSNLGNAEGEMGNFDNAEKAFEAALVLVPESPLVRWNYAMVQLLQTNFAQGWANYEHRWAQLQNRWAQLETSVANPGSHFPIWTGEPIAGKRILVTNEQGFGDTFQFSRYIVELEKRGAFVTFLVNAKLHAVMRSLSPTMALIDTAIDIDAHDFEIPLVSLPYVFQTDAKSIPSHSPYLQPDSARVKLWEERLGNHGFKIGLSWQGNLNAFAVRNRSTKLATFAPVFGIPNARIICIQKGSGIDAEIAASGLPIETLGVDFDNGPDAFADTAAVMASLDLIVTIDTSIAHLAGALGRPVWVALKKIPEWRWQMDRIDSPWYPSARLFRQPERDDWDSVVNAMVQELSSKTV